MNKSEWSSWVQALGVIATLYSAFWLMQYQSKMERKRLRGGAAALLNTFGGALNAVAEKLQPNGDRSQWDVTMMRVLLDAELQRTNNIPLQVLSVDEQRGVFAFRLSAYQIHEALKIAEKQLIPNIQSAIVTKEAYEFLQEVIKKGQIGIENGRILLGDIS